MLPVGGDYSDRNSRNLEMELVKGHLLMLVLATAGIGQCLSEDYCQWDTFTAKCHSDDEVIVMKKALYGRMSHGRCIDKNFGFVGCYTNVQYLADRRCSGRHECEITIPDMEFDDYSSCPKDLRRYFTAEYECVKVVRPIQSSCYQKHVVLQSPTGLLAGITTEKTGCGSADTPWIIQARPGQTVRFTLHNFALNVAWINGTVPVPQAESHCHVYAILKETHNPGQGKTICAGKSRQELVYKTSTSEVEVRVLTGSSNREVQRYFLLKYEVMGCPDIEVSSHTWAERSGEKVTIGCTGQAHEWRLTCNGTRWLGHRGNCTEASFAGSSTAVGSVSLPRPLSVVVIIAVAIVIGSLILVIGIICLKRRRSARQSVVQRNTTLPAKDPGVYPPLYTDSVPPFMVRHDASTENEYEYVEDIKPNLKPPSPPVLPPGDFKSCAVHGRAAANHGLVFNSAATAAPGAAQNNNKVPAYVDDTHEYMSTSSANIGTGIPQYYELDPHILDGGNRHVINSSSRSSSSSGGGPPQRDVPNSESHWHKPGSLGHYSQ